MQLVLPAFLLLGLMFGPSMLGQSTSGQSSLREFLALTPDQTLQVQQLNATYSQLVSSKQQRSFQVQRELDAEYAKAAPDARSLGERYLEWDSINQEVAAARSVVNSKVAGLLTSAQKVLLSRISASIVQQSLIRDAGCGYLTDVVSNVSSSATTVYVPSASFANFLLGDTPSSPGCPSEYPISIRDYLALTDAQVSGILNNGAAYQSLYARKQARIADVKVEIRDETAKPVPDPIALGARYAELIGIDQEVQAAGSQVGAASRALLTAAQSAKLQALMDGNSLSGYIFPAESCHFIPPPPGVPGSYYAETSCPTNF